MTFADAVELAKHSVIRIETHAAYGSGVMVTPHAALTNAHVVEGTASVSATNDTGATTTAQVARRDQRLDLAVVHMRDVTWPPVRIGDPASLREGDEVIALGHPLGLSFTATKGIVSARAREHRGNIYIQTDAAINPGSSGGPLLDRNGDAIGLTTFAASHGHALNFAIPIDRAMAAVRDVLADAREPSLICPACACEASVDELYCGTCGHRVGRTTSGSYRAVGAEMVALLMSHRRDACTACGTPSAGARYCLACGLRLRRDS
jgi:serine protease Do